MKFCFWGEIANALKGTTIGGGELQMALLARSLAKAGHDVVVIDPFTNESTVTTEGIKIFHVPNWNKGWRGFRFFRIPSFYKLLVKQKADYYYVRMRTYLNLFPYMAARKNNAKFLLALASDVDLFSLRDKYRHQYKDNFGLFNYLRHSLPNDLVFRFLIKRADYVIQQHPGQEVKKKKIRGKVVLFPNIIERTNLPVNGCAVGNYFIYLGSLTKMKGSDKLYDVIKNIDSKNQVMIVGQPNDRTTIPIYEQLKDLENADVKGRMGHTDAIQLLSHAKALINTSKFEGFPNVFLEAWAMGVPVLSLTVNPGNIFDKYDLGVCFNGDQKKMEEYINSNQVSFKNRQKMLDYITEFHDSDTASARFLHLLNHAEA